MSLAGLAYELARRAVLAWLEGYATNVGWVAVGFLVGLGAGLILGGWQR